MCFTLIVCVKKGLITVGLKVMENEKNAFFYIKPTMIFDSFSNSNKSRKIAAIEKFCNVVCNYQCVCTILQEIVFFLNVDMVKLSIILKNIFLFCDFFLWNSRF